MKSINRVLHALQSHFLLIFLFGFLLLFSELTRENCLHEVCQPPYYYTAVAIPVLLFSIALARPWSKGHIQFVRVLISALAFLYTAVCMYMLFAPPTALMTAFLIVMLSMVTVIIAVAVITIKKIEKPL